jgi:hypothetical protein
LAANNKLFLFRPTDKDADRPGNHSGGIGIVIHYWARNVLIENTRIWDSCEAIVVGREDTQVENVVIRRTLVFDLAGPASSTGTNPCRGRGIRLGRAAHADIYHVTIDNAVPDSTPSATGPLSAIRLARDAVPSAPLSDVDIWNSILNGSGSVVWLDAELSKVADFESDRNLYWHTDGSASHFKLTTSPQAVDLAGWRSATGQDITSQNADPLFIPDPRLNDYYTRLGSPARDQALNSVGGSFCGNGPDIGFLESCQ